jgi:hypothetical protein
LKNEISAFGCFKIELKLAKTVRLKSKTVEFDET